MFHFVPGFDKTRLYGVAAAAQRVFEFDPTVGRYGRIRDYGTLSGEESHFFFYLPFSKKLIPLGTLSSTPAACRCMARDINGIIYMGTSGLGHGAFDGRLYRYDAPAHRNRFLALDDVDRGEFSLTSMPPSGDFKRIDDLGAVVPGEGIVAACYEPVLHRIYGITSGGNFFFYDIAADKTSLKSVFAEFIVKPHNIPRSIAQHNSLIYFSGRHGHIIVYNPHDDSFRATNMKIPSGQGIPQSRHLSGKRLRRLVIYGGTSSDGLLFRFDPQNEEICNLGRPGIEHQITALTVGNDGTVWGLSGGPDQLTHLFRFDPRSRELEDMGMMRSRIPRIWVVHRASAMITGNDGELFIGESDAISHLLTYFPPIAATGSVPSAIS